MNMMSRRGHSVLLGFSVRQSSTLGGSEGSGPYPPNLPQTLHGHKETPAVPTTSAFPSADEELRGTTSGKSTPDNNSQSTDPQGGSLRMGLEPTKVGEHTYHFYNMEEEAEELHYLDTPFRSTKMGVGTGTRQSTITDVSTLVQDRSKAAYQSVARKSTQKKEKAFGKGPLIRELTQQLHRSKLLSKSKARRSTQSELAVLCGEAKDTLYRFEQLQRAFTYSYYRDAGPEIAWASDWSLCFQLCQEHHLGEEAVLLYSLMMSQHMKPLSKEFSYHSVEEDDHVTPDFVRSCRDTVLACSRPLECIRYFLLWYVDASFAKETIKKARSMEELVDHLDAVAQSVKLGPSAGSTSWGLVLRALYVSSRQNKAVNLLTIMSSVLAKPSLLSRLKGVYNKLDDLSVSPQKNSDLGDHTPAVDPAAHLDEVKTVLQQRALGNETAVPHTMLKESLFVPLLEQCAAEGDIVNSTRIFYLFYKSALKPRRVLNRVLHATLQGRPPGYLSVVSPSLTPQAALSEKLHVLEGDLLRRVQSGLDLIVKFAADDKFWEEIPNCEDARERNSTKPKGTRSSNLNHSAYYEYPSYGRATVLLPMANMMAMYCTDFVEQVPEIVSVTNAALVKILYVLAEHDIEPPTSVYAALMHSYLNAKDPAKAMSVYHTATNSISKNPVHVTNAFYGNAMRASFWLRDKVAADEVLDARKRITADFHMRNLSLSEEYLDVQEDHELTRLCSSTAAYHLLTYIVSTHVVDKEVAFWEQEHEAMGKLPPLQQRILKDFGKRISKKDAAEWQVRAQETFNLFQEYIASSIAAQSANRGDEASGKGDVDLGEACNEILLQFAFLLKDRVGALPDRAVGVLLRFVSMTLFHVENSKVQNETVRLSHATAKVLVDCIVGQAYKLNVDEVGLEMFERAALASTLSSAATFTSVLHRDLWHRTLVLKTLHDTNSVSVCGTSNLNNSINILVAPSVLPQKSDKVSSGKDLTLPFAELAEELLQTNARDRGRDESQVDNEKKINFILPWRCVRQLNAATLWDLLNFDEKQQTMNPNGPVIPTSHQLSSSHPPQRDTSSMLNILFLPPRPEDTTVTITGPTALTSPTGRIRSGTSSSGTKITVADEAQEDVDAALERETEEHEAAKSDEVDAEGGSPHDSSSGKCSIQVLETVGRDLLQLQDVTALKNSSGTGRGISFLKHSTLHIWTHDPEEASAVHSHLRFSFAPSSQYSAEELDVRRKNNTEHIRHRNLTRGRGEIDLEVVDIRRLRALRASRQLTENRLIASHGASIGSMLIGAGVEKKYTEAASTALQNQHELSRTSQGDASASKPRPKSVLSGISGFDGSKQQKAKQKPLPGSAKESILGSLMGVKKK